MTKGALLAMAVGQWMAVGLLCAFGVIGGGFTLVGSVPGRCSFAGSHLSGISWTFVGPRKAQRVDTGVIHTIVA